jgi:hypothetical protein
MVKITVASSVKAGLASLINRVRSLELNAKPAPLIVQTNSGGSPLAGNLLIDNSTQSITIPVPGDISGLDPRYTTRRTRLIVRITVSFSKNAQAAGVATQIFSTLTVAGSNVPLPVTTYAVPQNTAPATQAYSLDLEYVTPTLPLSSMAPSTVTLAFVGSVAGILSASYTIGYSWITEYV